MPDSVRTRLENREVIPEAENPYIWQGIMTVRGAMVTFGISNPRTVINACIYDKIVSTKLDADIGERGGTYIMNAHSAYLYFAPRYAK